MLLNATKAGKARAPAESPNTFRKKTPATITSEVASSSFEMAEK
jgi:hypothetical protein